MNIKKNFRVIWSVSLWSPGQGWTLKDSILDIYEFDSFYYASWSLDDFMSFIADEFNMRQMSASQLNDLAFADVPDELYEWTVYSNYDHFDDQPELFRISSWKSDVAKELLDRGDFNGI